ncbi:MAG: hypothetical protein ABJC09_02125 [Terriglobia bacterium]
MTRAPHRRQGLSPQHWLLIVFAISRVLYFAAGIRFDIRPLDHNFQIVDPLLMKTRLLETLFYLHTQPPGFNLLIGVIVKIFPAYAAVILDALYMACGASLCWSLFGLMRILQVRTAVAFTLTALFICSPGVVLFENYLMYEYPIMALLCASAVILHSLIERPTFRVASLFFFVLTIMMYIRAVFQLEWLVLLVALLAWLMKGHRKMILSAAALPLALVLALYVKNEIVFGTFSTSTWLGFNADTITLHQLTPEEHEKLIAAGLVSTVGRIPSMEPLSAFRGIEPPAAPTEIPVLDQLEDSTGRVNYNNIGYLPLHAYYVHDARAIILHYPKAYLRSVVRAAFTYFLPSGDFPFFDQNGPHIESFDRIFNIVFFGQWKTAPNRKDLRAIEAQGGSLQLPLYTGTYLLLGLPALFCFGLIQAWRAFRLSAELSSSAMVLAYVLFQIAYITAIVSLLSCFENNRYRLPIDPFFVALLGLAIERVIRAFQSRSGQTSPTSALRAA